MKSFDDNIYEEDNTDLISMPEIRDLHYELISENIRDQIEDPFDNNTNFIETFSETCEQMKDTYENNIDVLNQIKQGEKDFYMEIIRLIDTKYDLDIDFDTIQDHFNNKDIQMMCETLYEFFIIKYKKNIKSFFVNFINNNKSQILNEFESLRKKKDVSTISLKKKISNKDMVPIVSNILEVISFIKSLEVTPERFITYYNLDKVYNAKLKGYIEDNIITGNFVNTFLGPVFDDDQDYNFDSIVSSIQKNLCDK